MPEARHQRSSSIKIVNSLLESEHDGLCGVPSRKALAVPDTRITVRRDPVHFNRFTCLKLSIVYS